MCHKHKINLTNQTYRFCLAFWVQNVLFGILAPIGRALGYKAHYPEFLEIPRETVAELEPLPDWVELSL